jgi:hypothetical protein
MGLSRCEAQTLAVTGAERKGDKSCRNDQRDWEVVVAADCVESYDRQHHEISLRYMKDKIAALMSNAEIGRMLGPASTGC